MTNIIEELREILNHKEDDTLRRCLDEIVSLQQKVIALERIRVNVLDQLDRMTQASINEGSGKAAAARNRK